MTAIITNSYRIHNARQFEEEFAEANQIFYLGIGRPAPWSTESSPDTPTDTFNQMNNGELWRDMIGAKKILSTDVDTVVPRVNWTTGTVYDMYQHDDTAMFTKSFLVLADGVNVYKCIRNGLVGDAGTSSTTTSTVKPDHVTPNTTPIESDGYMWRFMYTVSSANITKYLTTSWMPVISSTNSAVDTNIGSVHVVLLTAVGSGYTNGTVSLGVSGDGTGFAANVTITSNSVANVTVTNVGTGYTQLTLTLSSGGGSGATFKPIYSPGGKLAGRGHGWDLEEECGGFYRLLNCKLEFGETSTLTTSNDYRRVMVIKNPYNWGTTTIATVVNRRQTQRLTAAVVSGTLVADETVTGGTSTATAKVVEWDAASTHLFLTNSSVVEGLTTAWTNGETLTGGTSGATVTYSAGTVDNPDLEPGSGLILYVENRAAIVRSADQSEDFKIIFEF